MRGQRRKWRGNNKNGKKEIKPIKRCKEHQKKKEIR
jgi:hypothetical protein